MRFALLLGITVLATLSVSGSAWAAPDEGGSGEPQGEEKPKKEKCDTAPVIDQLCSANQAVTGAIGDAVSGTAGSAAEAAAGAAASGVMAQATEWMAGGAMWVSGEIHKLTQATTTPELTARWYRDQLGVTIAFGLGLATLVAMIALISAALRRDPEALGAIFIGMFKAGILTGLLLSLTVLALGVADEFSNAVAGGEGSGQRAWWEQVGEVWKGEEEPGAMASAVAFLFALAQVVVGLAVLLELVIREAVIYVAVLFMPIALAASIWPPLRSWQSGLTKTLGVFILLKPVVMVILALAGSAVAAKLGGDSKGNEVGTILAAIVIMGLAAFAPWALMALFSMDSESTFKGGMVSQGARASMTQGGRVGGGLGSAGAGAGRSARSGGGTAARKLGSGGAGNSSGGGGGSGQRGESAKAEGAGSSTQPGMAATMSRDSGLEASQGSGKGPVAAAAGMTQKGSGKTSGSTSQATRGQTSGTGGQSRPPAGPQRRQTQTGQGGGGESRSPGSPQRGATQTGQGGAGRASGGPSTGPRGRPAGGPPTRRGKSTGPPNRGENR